MKNLHNDILNLPCSYESACEAYEMSFDAYKAGHRDARHAAAELANEADWHIKELTDALRMLINSLPINRDWLDPGIERFARGLTKKFGEKK